MAANGCVNGSLDVNYSSPVPVIGLYIAAGSAVCLLLMLFDLISAIRRRQRWIPCRLFSLNSVTLTLISVATKLTVDLTTSMPRVIDQLSKLTGTVLICSSMGFLGPSVSNMSGSEYISNMSALSILVVTVVVNMGIQIYTGVIQLFIPEHIIIMCSMWVMLLLLWYSASDINIKSSDTKDFIRQGFFDRRKHTNTSMLDRMRLCYQTGFFNNPQLSTCLHINHSTLAGICLISFCVLVQATIRSLVLKQLKFCQGNSDYNWSMWIIVITQISTVSVGCVSTISRWFTYFRVIRWSTKYEEGIIDFQIRRLPFLGTPWHRCGILLQNYVWHIILLARILITAPSVLVFTILGGKIDPDRSNSWVMEKLTSSIKRWTDQTTEEDPCHHSLQILSRTQRLHHSDATRLDENLWYSDTGIWMCPLSIILLVRIANICMPCDITKSLAYSLDEVYEIIDFVDTRIKSQNLTNTTKSKLAKAMFAGNGFRGFLLGIQKQHHDGQEYQSLSPLERARFHCQKLRDEISGIGIDTATNPSFRHMDTIESRQSETVKEIYTIIEAIKGLQFETIEQVHCYIEQIYVDMLHLYLAQFPLAVFKEMMETPAEECGERARRALKMLIKLQSLEDNIKWLFPVDTDTNCLVNPPIEDPLVFVDTIIHDPDNIDADASSTLHGDAILDLKDIK